MTHLLIDKNEREYNPDPILWKPREGLFNLKPYPIDFPINEILQRPATMWRYQEALPVLGKDITLGEGMTPLLPLDAGYSRTMVKMDYLMPTGSFKDRGAAVLIAKAKGMGIKSVIADSSGNAGTAIAAYCARAGITCHIYAPAATSDKKLQQIKAYGAELHLIDGTREETAHAAQEAVEREGSFYASHVYNPFFYEGTKTFAYEVWEQLGWQAPDTLVLPVGNGTLVLGAHIGFQDLQRAGQIDRVPKIIAVQAEGCAPIAEAFKKGANVEPVNNTGTKAEGIAIADPARGSQIIDAIQMTGGIVVKAPEENIEPARKELARKGFYVEPTTAATYAACLNLPPELLGEKAVLSLCGSGMKK